MCQTKYAITQVKHRYIKYEASNCEATNFHQKHHFVYSKNLHTLIPNTPTSMVIVQIKKTPAN